jgi:hypothetical protein
VASEFCPVIWSLTHTAALQFLKEISLTFFLDLYPYFPSITISYQYFSARSHMIPFCLLMCHWLILYVCLAQNNRRRMTNKEERLVTLGRTLHSLATRVPKIILTRVDWTFPVLENKAVSMYIRRIYMLWGLLMSYLSGSKLWCQVTLSILS